MKNYKIVLIVLSAFITDIALAEEEIEEIIVTSSYIDQTLSEIENPLHVVSGDVISSSASQSLGESIDDLLGVSSTDFGSGVGQPIIRGMSGNRVKVLNNGMVVRDVSGLGADHINEVDLNNIQQIEIVLGPSSLLYSNGTIGGIINIVDNTIARSDFEESKFQLGYERQSVNDGDSQNLSYENNIEGLNLSFGYKNSEFSNFDIPHGAIIHDDDDDHAGEEEELSFLENSDFESESLRLGLSKTGDWGHIGASISNIESLYGIPFHGEEHDEEPHEEERIFSTTDSDKFNLVGSYNLKNNLIKKIDYYFRDTDYALTEQHAEEHDEPHDPDEEEEGPTLFTNDASEYGVTIDLSNDSLSQRAVINFVNEDTSIFGEEVFMNPASNDEMTIGYYISKDLDLFHLDLGFRLDQIDTKGSVSEEHPGEPKEIEYFDKDQNNSSFAFSIGRDLNDSLDMSFGFASVKRAPSVVELFMNGPHLSTGRFEVGNTNLSSEKSNNIDVTINFVNGNLYGVATIFRNNIDNYIYLLDEDDDHADDDDHDPDDPHGHPELIHANYVQQDAELDGFEFKIGKVFNLKNGELNLSFGRDMVNGNFSNGKNIPRLNPARNIFSLAYSGNDLIYKINIKDVEKQNDFGEGETATEGYLMLDTKLVKTINLNNDSELMISVFANNLLDEIARNHSSFVKDEVPLPGRNYGIRFNYNF